MSGIVNTTGAVSGVIGVNARAAAGQIVQTTTAVIDDSYTNTTSPVSQQWYTTVVTAPITPKYDNSSILVFANFSTQIQDTSGDNGYGFRFNKTGTGVSNAYGSPHMGPTIQDEGHSVRYLSPGSNTHDTGHNQMVLMDAVSETTSTVTYTVQVAVYAVTTSVKVGGNEWDNYQWSLYFQEIKR